MAGSRSSTEQETCVAGWTSLPELRWTSLPEPGWTSLPELQVDQIARAVTPDAAHRRSSLPGRGSPR